MNADTQKQVARFLEVLGRIIYPDFQFLVGTKGETLYLQIECDDRDNVTGSTMRWKSRKWLLSPHMTDGEIVQTAFKATMTAVEHEARERFKYRGVSVFDPHYDIDELALFRGGAGAIKERG